MFVTHDQEEALAIADRVGVMRAGKLEQIAPPEELYSAPTTQFVAEFVGLTNRLRATVSDGIATVAGTQIPTLEGSLRDGTGVALVRPESIHVEADPAGNATIVTTSFLGAISRLTIDTGDLTLVAQIPRTRVAGFGCRRQGAGHDRSRSGAGRLRLAAA